MDYRIAVSKVYLIMIAAVVVCAVAAFRSAKKIGKSVALVNVALISPLVGNYFIVRAVTEPMAYTGYYIYFIGMDILMLALLYFTAEYCAGAGEGQKVPVVLPALMIIDIGNILLNFVLGHAFEVEEIDYSGDPYFRLKPHFGQAIHRVSIYLVLIMIMLVFAAIIIKMPGIYKERYRVILFTMLAIAALQTFFIFSRTPIDVSIATYGLFGFLVFYFSLYYHPLRLLDQMLSDIVSNMSEAIFLFDPNMRCFWVNERATEMTGIRKENMDHAMEKISELVGEVDCSGQENWSSARISGRGENIRYFVVKKQIMKDDKGTLTGIAIGLIDNTEEQQKLREEIYNATHDGLTGLFTREYLYESVKKALAANPYTSYLATFVNIRNFKVVNDIFGTDFGDLVLKKIADWIRVSLSDECKYGRIGGDTFGALIPADEFDADRIEEKLSHFVVKNDRFEHMVLVHVGVYPVEKSDRDVSVMFDRAHLAISRITDNYNKHIAWYDNDLREKILWDQRITVELEDAIGSMQVRPYLQPIADRRGRIVGAEALARWIHPQLGFLSPAAFIPLLEKNGLIAEVDRHMWRCACALLSRWEEKESSLFLSVNISPKDFYFMDVAEELKSLTEEYGVNPVRLRVEITETIMMSEGDERLKVLDKLREYGFIVEMDDFGSGYSSLNLLKEMPVDVLKIDMRFLSKSGDVGKAKTIVKNIINLSEELEIASLTEGVETREQYKALLDMGCKLFQGYYFAKPMSVEDFEERVFEEKTNTAKGRKKE